MRRTCLRCMPDRPQHPDLAAPLDHRQRQGVDDAEDRDHDGQAEQAVEQPEQAVDLARQRALELVAVLDVDDVVRFGRLLQAGAQRGEVGARGGLDQRDLVGPLIRRRERAVDVAGDDPGADQVGVVVDAGDRLRVTGCAAAGPAKRCDVPSVQPWSFAWSATRSAATPPVLVRALLDRHRAARRPAGRRPRCPTTCVPFDRRPPGRGARSPTRRRRPWRRRAAAPSGTGTPESVVRM